MERVESCVTSSYLLVYQANSFADLYVSCIGKDIPYIKLHLISDNGKI